MALVERKIFIKASYDKIEEMTTLAAQEWPQWFVGIESAEPDANYPNEGSTVKIHYKAAGLGFDLMQTLEKFVKNQKTVFRMDGMIKGTQSWSGQVDGDGVWITVVFDYEIPGGGLGKIADKLVVERMNTKNLEQSLENLKARVEASA